MFVLFLLVSLSHSLQLFQNSTFLKTPTKSLLLSNLCPEKLKAVRQKAEIPLPARKFLKPTRIEVILYSHSIEVGTWFFLTPETNPVSSRSLNLPSDWHLIKTKSFLHECHFSYCPIFFHSQLNWINCVSALPVDGVGRKWRAHLILGKDVSTQRSVQCREAKPE